VRFMEGQHPLADLAPRDVVAKAIMRRMRETGAKHVWLDAREFGTEMWEKRFPTILASLRTIGVDPSTDLIPVAPAQHYASGGVRTDAYGRSTVQGLYAVGECACTGVHGANRLASNSLLEGLVFGARAANAMLGLAPSAASGEIPRSEVFPAITESHLRSITWEHCGITRNEEGLQKAVDILRSVPLERRADASRLDYELRSMRRVGLLIAQAALERRESRGGHYRSDYPEKAAEAVHSRLVRQA